MFESILLAFQLLNSRGSSFFDQSFAKGNSKCRFRPEVCFLSLEEGWQMAIYPFLVFSALLTVVAMAV